MEPQGSHDVNLSLCGVESAWKRARSTYLVSKVQNKILIRSNYKCRRSPVRGPISPSPPLTAHPQASHTALAHARPGHCHHLVGRKGVVDVEDGFAVGRSVAQKKDFKVAKGGWGRV